LEDIEEGRIIWLSRVPDVPDSGLTNGFTCAVSAEPFGRRRINGLDLVCIAQQSDSASLDERALAARGRRIVNGDMQERHASDMLANGAFKREFVFADIPGRGTPLPPGGLAYFGLPTREGITYQEAKH